MKNYFKKCKNHCKRWTTLERPCIYVFIHQRQCEYIHKKCTAKINKLDIIWHGRNSIELKSIIYQTQRMFLILVMQYFLWHHCSVAAPVVISSLPAGYQFIDSRTMDCITSKDDNSNQVPYTIAAINNIKCVFVGDGWVVVGFCLYNAGQPDYIVGFKWFWYKSKVGLYCQLKVRTVESSLPLYLGTNSITCLSDSWMQPERVCKSSEKCTLFQLNSKLIW